MTDAEKLDRAEEYIAYLRDQIDRERRDMRERFGAEIAMLRAQNDRLVSQLAQITALDPWPTRIVARAIGESTTSFGGLDNFTHNKRE